MEVDAWRGEGVFQGEREGVWISRHQTDHISPNLENSENQEYFSPALQQRREIRETRKDIGNLEEPESQPGKEVSEVAHIFEVTVEDTDNTSGRSSGETLEGFGQESINSRLAWIVPFCLCMWGAP